MLLGSLRDGQWTSKIGGLRDFRHKTPECLCGAKYGTVYRYMKRRVPSAPSSLPPFPLALRSL